MVTDRNDTSGIAEVLTLLGVRGEVPAPEENQAEMFDAPEAAQPIEPRATGERKVGRPKGARNRSTEEWCRFILSQHKSPLTVLPGIYGISTADLHAQLQEMANQQGRKRRVVTETSTREVEEKILINPLDVLKVQMAAATAVLPYLHKKQPVDVSVTERPRGVFLLDGGEFTDLEEVGTALPLPNEVEENQQVSGAEDLQSDASLSDADAKPLDRKVFDADSD